MRNKFEFSCDTQNLTPFCGVGWQSLLEGGCYVAEGWLCVAEGGWFVAEGDVT